MTKEELEDSIYDSIWDSVYAESGLVMGCNNAVGKCLETSLEYTKSQVIAYELWINEMLMDDSSFNYEKTPEQLYNLFLENQLKNGGK